MSWDTPWVSPNNNLAIQTGGFLTPAGTDQVEPNKSLFLFQGATTTATLSSDGGGHIYEGPVDPAFPADPLHPFDLMNAGRTIGPPPTRELISDLDAGILHDAYGYTIKTPLTIQTFLANLNPATGVLTVNGDVNTDAAGTKIFVNDTITLDRQGANLRVNVDGVTSAFPIAAITSVQVLSTGGNDAINLDYANGSPVPSGGISVDGGPPSTLPGDSLTVSNTGSSAVTYTPSTPGNGGSGTLAVGSDMVRFTNIESVGFNGPVGNFTYVTPGSQDVLTIDSPGPGQNRISGTSDGVTLLPFTFSGITNFTLDTATNDGASPDDSITLSSPLVATGLQNFTINTGPGADTFTSFANFALPVSGGAFTYNAGTQLTAPGDNLIIHGTGTSTGGFAPAATTGDGTITEDGTSLVTTGLERAEVNAFSDFTETTAGTGPDNVVVDRNGRHQHPGREYRLRPERRRPLHRRLVLRDHQLHDRHQYQRRDQSR